jgi:hypothetical protein
MAQSASTATGSLAGNVVDPQGAVIPQATVIATRIGGAPAKATTADGLGHFSLTGLAPGLYTVQAQATGFRGAVKEGVPVAAGAAKTLNLTLEIEIQQQQVVVTADAADVTSQEKNGGAVVLKGSDLVALSDNQDELQQQLEAIAGADPETGTNFYVDGFSGGKLPPKSAIREIRINQNPYSAQYDSMGWGRIEIFTKPGADRLHADFWMQGNDSSFNALNPFVKSQPAYYSYQYQGDINGPITKNSSYFTSLYNQKSSADAIIDAETLDASFNEVQVRQAVSAPTSNLNISPRYDLQLGKSQTLSLRYQFQRSTQTNGGVGQAALASQGFNSDNTEQMVMFSDDQAYGPKIVNQTRFQYVRDRANQTSLSGPTAGPTIAVQGAFTDGGSGTGSVQDKQDHYEFQDYLQITAGNHDLNLGGRLRSLRESNTSTANFNGQYTFATLDAYKITLQGLANGLKAAEIRAMGGGASQYSQTQGTPSIAVSLVDTGLFAEDNWKVKPNITLSYGLRFETQTDIHDHADFGPRSAISWPINGKDKKPIIVLRTGAGFFYQRFQAANVLQARRQNGVTERALVVNNPDFYPANCVTTPKACTVPSSSPTQASAPAIYQINPDLRTPYIFQTGFGFDKQIGKIASISANYVFTRGQHLYLTRNINAPIGYNPADPTSGTRPLGIDENIDEFESDGVSTRNRLVINGNLHFRHINLWGYDSFGKIQTNTSGISSFPSNSYNLHEDYGRAPYDNRNRLVLGGETRLPGKVTVSPFLFYQSSAPFNIVVGQDLNGDTQFNDRPVFATDLSRSSVYVTKYGTFDADPLPGQKIIPIDYGKGPSLVLANLRIGRSFAFGPEVKGDSTDDGKTDAKADSKAAPAAKSPAKIIKKEIQRRYELTFGAGADNILNHPNLASPVGVLGSPLFGKSTSLTSVWGDATTSRSINLQTSFRF